MTLTNYLGNALLDHTFGKQTFTASTTLYVGLATAVDSSGTVTGEPASTNGYARVAITNNDVATVWSTAAAKSKNNSHSAITFPAATASWGTLTVMFISNTATTGSIYCYGNLTASITPVAGVAPVITPGNLVETWT
jgi:hypothetical protein